MICCVWRLDIVLRETWAGILSRTIVMGMTSSSVCPSEDVGVKHGVVHIFGAPAGCACRVFSRSRLSCWS